MVNTFTIKTITQGGAAPTITLWQAACKAYLDTLAEAGISKMSSTYMVGNQREMTIVSFA